jgi:transposase
MSKVNRNEPKRSSASESTITWFEFEREFPDDAACLDYLVRELYPNGDKHMIPCPTCGKETKHHRVKARPAYACQFCGHHEYPMVGTIFEGSATSLRLWFFAMYTMASTRCGVSAKQLERELGVTYKTAWRMFNKIRSLMDQDESEPFSGTVEVDEAYIGGKSIWRNRGLPVGDKATPKTMVLGMAERREGTTARLHVTVADPKSDGRSLAGRVTTKVLPASSVYTDEAIVYWNLGKMGVRHERVNHQQHVYVSGDVHTNTIEGFWSLLKRGISGVYHGVSTKHLQSYADEYVFRYNHRDVPGGMFNALLGRIEKG